MGMKMQLARVADSNAKYCQKPHVDFRMYVPIYMGIMLENIQIEKTIITDFIYSYPPKFIHSLFQNL